MANIILLEDEPMVARVMARMLSIDQHQVTTALDREEFEAFLNEKPGYFDLVICDWSLSRETGWDVLMSNLENIPRRVLFASARFPEDFAAKVKELENNDKIVFRLNKIQARLCHSLHSCKF